MPGENILQTLQKYATIVHQLDELAKDLSELRTTVTSRVEKLEGQAADMRERLARLEAARNADRAEMQADLARFKAEVERAELKLTRCCRQLRISRPCQNKLPRNPALDLEEQDA